jgi:hypothetical protein
MANTASTAQMRASDADRDTVLAELSEHFQAGRLTQDEFDDRAGRALAARTWGELADLKQDLPGNRQGTWPGPQNRPVPPLAPRAADLPVQSHRHPGLGPIALIGIGMAVAGGLEIAHGHWGFVWLIIIGLFWIRHLVRHAGFSGRC